MKKHSFAFVDGSFNPTTKVYGGGGFVIDQFGKKHLIKVSGSDPAYSAMRNVAGEILAAMEAIKIATNLKMKKLTIYHDYEGISKWPLGGWQAKKKETQQYAKFVWSAINEGMKIYFEHVKSHSGDLLNDEADALAKAAAGLGVK